MKAIRTKEAKSRNPLFSVSERRKAKRDGVEYDTPEFVSMQPGETLDHPDCWRIVVKGYALPADAECAQKVLAYLGEPGRQAIKDDIELLRQAAKTQQLPEKDLKKLQAMEKAYAVELGLLDSHASLRSKAEGLLNEPGATGEVDTGSGAESDSGGITDTGTEAQDSSPAESEKDETGDSG